jgi:hypothetical protein
MKNCFLRKSALLSALSRRTIFSSRRLRLKPSRRQEYSASLCDNDDDVCLITSYNNIVIMAEEEADLPQKSNFTQREESPLDRQEGPRQHQEEGGLQKQLSHGLKRRRT